MMDRVNPRVVTLTAEALQAEKERILAVARALPEGGQGKVDLMPWLHFGQCWEIIDFLAANDFSVWPDSRTNTKGYVKFRFNQDGALTLRFQHGRASAAEEGGQGSGKNKGDRVLELLQGLNIPPSPPGEVDAPAPVKRRFMRR